jgi:hypothetical protein
VPNNGGPAKRYCGPRTEESRGGTISSRLYPKPVAPYFQYKARHDVSFGLTLASQKSGLPAARPFRRANNSVDESCAGMRGRSPTPHSYSVEKARTSFRSLDSRLGTFR